METRSGKRRRIDFSLRPCTSSSGEDRLSVLPDELLTRILGMLPTKDAAVTTVTSNKGFMPAFSALRNFVFDDCPISHCLKSPCLVKRTPAFKQFVDYVLRASRSQQIHRFTLRFGRFCGDNKRWLSNLIHPCEGGGCHPPLEPDRLNSWLSFPLSRRVRELDLCINVQLSPGCNKLPRSIFVCETLETLKLDSNLDLDVGDDVKAFPIRLPRLKLLHLRTFLFTEDAFVTKLVGSCPVLEDLLLACCWERGDVFAISSPSLLKFDLTVNKCDRPKSSTNVIIQTPNLQYFKYWDYLAQHYSISYMSALVQAEIAIYCKPGENESCWNLCSILESCSAVSHLSLQSYSIRCLDLDELEHQLPMFPNLNYLELGYNPSTYWGKVLVVFLECSPSLTTLVFPEGLTFYYSNIHAEREGIQLERECLKRDQAIIPSCCKSHLKRIVIKYYCGIRRELDLIQFLLQKALVLENLDISIAEENKRAPMKLRPVVVQRALLEIPRASKICSVTVS